MLDGGSMTNYVNITVNGSGNPQTVAHEVKRVLEDIFYDLSIKNPLLVER
jgi:hypothetical protein